MRIESDPGIWYHIPRHKKEAKWPDSILPFKTSFS